MQTIITKVLPQTNTKPTRIKATSLSGISVTLSRDQFDTLANAHREAAYALMVKLDWTGTMIGGDIREGMVWVFYKDAPILGREQN